MSPYRRPPQLDETGSADRGDALVLGAMLLVIGGLRIVIALVNHEVFGAEATIALLMVAVSAVGCSRGRG